MNEQTTQTAGELAAELAQKRDRLKELEKEHAASTRAASVASRELADGVGDIEASTQAQQRATALDAARRELSSRIAGLEAQEADLRAQSEREKQAAQLCDLAARAAEHWKIIDEKQRAAGDALFGTCQEIIAERGALNATRRQFAQLVGDLQEVGGARTGDNSVLSYESVEAKARRLLRAGGVEVAPDFLTAAAQPLGSNQFPPEPAPLDFALSKAIESTGWQMERENRAAQNA